MGGWHRRFAGHRPPGTAHLVYDQAADVYQCYWFGGRSTDHLLEHTEVATAADAVAWAEARTPRARIRLPDHRTYWAGTGPSPGGFAGIWKPSASTADIHAAPPRHPNSSVDATRDLTTPIWRRRRGRELSPATGSIPAHPLPHPIGRSWLLSWSTSASRQVVR